MRPEIEKPILWRDLSCDLADPKGGNCELNTRLKINLVGRGVPPPKGGDLDPTSFEEIQNLVGHGADRFKTCPLSSFKERHIP